MHAARTRAALWLVGVLACGSRASALNAALDVNQYVHTAWTIGGGSLPARVLSIAQTPDGYLWLGSESGLFRFDGVRAVRWQPREHDALPGTTIYKLLVARDGRLWIGTLGGLATCKEGRLVTYPELAGQAVGTLTEDAQGTVWAGTIAGPNTRVCAIRRQVQCSGDDNQLGAAVLSLFEDRGTVWAATTTGLWQWSPGAPTRCPAPRAPVADGARIKNGPLVIATTGRIKQLVGDTLAPYRITGVDRPFAVKRLLADRDGGLWIGTVSHGLIHVHRGQVDRFTVSDGLSGESIRALYEDREGNIWVATNEGLDRFRERAVTAIASDHGMPASLVASVLQARDGNVWVGSPEGLTRWRDGRVKIYGPPDGLPDARVGALFEDTTGRILAATPRGMAVLNGNHFIPLASFPTRIVYNIVEDGAGDLWVNDQEHGLIHLAREQAVRRIPWSALGRDDHATAMVADGTQHGLWLGFYKGGLLHVEDGSPGASYGTADGLGAGRVSELQRDRDGALWAATAGGLSRIKDDRVGTLTTATGLPCDGVHWTLRDTAGAVWLLMPCGLGRIAAAELAAWQSDRQHSVSVTLFDTTDGVRSQSTPIGFTPPAARLADGRIWFATPNGVGVLDPRHLPLNTLPPPVHIEQIVADRKPYPVSLESGTFVALPPLLRDLQIDYTALSLVAPEKISFRYRLDGYDRDWQDAGNRRQAFYNNLSPRSYRFRVIASNNSGVWNDTGAFVDLSVAPAYYQTTWFMALSVATVVALAWGAHRLRVRIVKKHQNEISALNERLMKAQEQERIRIAGELHDGVMQEMLAATMMLGTAKRRIPAGSEATATIDKVQEKLIQAGTDLRQLSHDLHPPLLHDGGLPAALHAYCEQFGAASGIPVACEAADDVRELSRGAALALFRIVQEALGNVAKHASATQVSVRLSRSDGLVSLTVSDDGVGLDPGRIARHGGLGLVMMRERATQLNGRFDVESAPGGGTTIRVVVPFR